MYKWTNGELHARGEWSQTTTRSERKNDSTVANNCHCVVSGAGVLDPGGDTLLSTAPVAPLMAHAGARWRHPDDHRADFLIT